MERGFWAIFEVERAVNSLEVPRRRLSAFKMDERFIFWRKMERGFWAIFEVEQAVNFLMKDGKRISGDFLT